MWATPATRPVVLTVAVNVWYTITTLEKVLVNRGEGTYPGWDAGVKLDWNSRLVYGSEA